MAAGIEDGGLWVTRVEGGIEARDATSLEEGSRAEMPVIEMERMSPGEDRLVIAENVPRTPEQPEG